MKPFSLHSAAMAGLVAATLALSACGHSEKAAETTSADNVEMPAEAAMSGVASGALPAADSAATADTAASAASSGPATVEDMAKAAAEAASSADGKGQ